MTVPEIIILDAVDEVSIIDSYLGMYGFKEQYTDKVIRDVYEHLREFKDAALKLELYLLKIQREEQEYGELIVPWIRKLHEATLHQLLDKQIYRQDGILPYQYERRLGNDTMFLSLKGANRGLIRYKLSGLPPR
jgi:hypothetical protein